MKKEDFINIMQEIAPAHLADDFDNPGLLIDCESDEIRKVLLALDCTMSVAEEAVRGGYDLVLVHHPLIFNPMKNILRSDPVGCVVYKLIRNGIGLFAAHTNLDKAKGGVNDTLCRLFKLENCVTVEPDGYGRVGDLPHEMTLSELIKYTDEVLNTKTKCATANFETYTDSIIIRRVGVLGGSGGDDTAFIKSYGADAYITGEVKHNQAIEAQHMGINLLMAGHYETENPVMTEIIGYLQKQSFGVEYKLSECAQSPLRVFEKR